MAKNEKECESIYTLENLKAFVVGVAIIGLFIYLISEDSVFNKFLDEIREKYPTFTFIFAVIITIYMLVKGIKNHKKGMDFALNWQLTRGLILLLILTLIII